jgi:glycerate kinase
MRVGTAAIPRRALLACEPFGARLDAASVAQAISSGLTAAGQPEPDRLALPAGFDDHGTAELLDREGFHARMRAARAVVLAVPALSERTLAGSSAFEIATLARQSGVPCYAIAGDAALNAFDLRMLDLQIVLEASGRAGLRRAGVRLAELI